MFGLFNVRMRGGKGQRGDVIAEEVEAPFSLVDAHADIETGVVAVALDGEIEFHATAHVKTFRNRGQEVGHGIRASLQRGLNLHTAEANAAVEICAANSSDFVRAAFSSQSERLMAFFMAAVICPIENGEKEKPFTPSSRKSAAAPIRLLSNRTHPLKAAS